jgi:hypothetical protein
VHLNQHLVRVGGGFGHLGKAYLPWRGWVCYKSSHRRLTSISALKVTAAALRAFPVWQGRPRRA